MYTYSTRWVTGITTTVRQRTVGRWHRRRLFHRLHQAHRGRKGARLYALRHLAYRQLLAFHSLPVAGARRPCVHGTPAGASGCMVANFTIFYSETADGDYKKHTAQIIDWPVHSRGRPWDYGPCVPPSAETSTAPLCLLTVPLCSSVSSHRRALHQVRELEPRSFGAPKRVHFFARSCGTDWLEAWRGDYHGRQLARTIQAGGKRQRPGQMERHHRKRRRSVRASTFIHRVDRVSCHRPSISLCDAPSHRLQMDLSTLQCGYGRIFHASREICRECCCEHYIGLCGSINAGTGINCTKVCPCRALMRGALMESLGQTLVAPMGNTLSTDVSISRAPTKLPTAPSST